MKRITLFTLSLFIFSYTVKCQTNAIISVSENNNKLNVAFDMSSFEVKDTSFMKLYGVAEIFNYIQIDDEFGIIDSIGLPQLPQLSFDLHVPYNATNFEIVSSK